MAEIEIRMARAGDLDAMYALYAEVQALHAAAEPEEFGPPVKDALFERYFAELMADPERRLAFAEGGAPVGYVEYWIGLKPRSIYRPERRLAYVNTLVVATASRGRGLASALLAHVLAEARTAGATQIGVDHWRFNAAARACFETAGFEVCRETLRLAL